MKMQTTESMLSYSNGFEKTECVGKKLKNIAPNTGINEVYSFRLISCYKLNSQHEIQTNR